MPRIWTTRRRRRARVAAAALFLATIPAPLHAQVMEVGGGTSTLYRAHGSSLRYYTPDYTVGFDMGYGDRRVAGGFLRTRAGGWTVNLGDETFAFGLPGQVVSSTRTLTVRGLGLSRETPKLRVSARGGALSKGVSAPYFQAAEPGPGASLITADYYPASSLRLFSRNIAADRLTSVSGAVWIPRTGLELDAALGNGSGRAFGAAGAAASASWFDLKAAYASDHGGLRNIRTPMPPNAEPVRESVNLTLRPPGPVTVALGHQNLAQPWITGSDIEATLDQGSVRFEAFGFRFAGAYYRSQLTNGGGSGISLTAGQKVDRWLEIGAEALSSRARHEKPFTSGSLNLEEWVSPRLKLLQVVNLAKGAGSVAWGGELITNPATVSVEYQTQYVPFRARRQFHQTLVVTGRLRPFGNLQVTASTHVAPDGTARYTLYGTTFFYGSTGSAVTPPAQPELSPWLIEGRVVDEEGRAVRGAALKLDKAIVFTDSDGDFFVRFPHAREARLTVLTDQFLVPGSFEVVEAPGRVSTAREDEATPIVVTVRRVPSTDPASK